jgi:hypothetical protein
MVISTIDTFEGSKMKKLLGLIVVGILFPQLNSDYEIIRQRRAELPKDILVDASNGSQIYMGRCGFVEVGDSPTILQEEVDTWVSAHHRDDTRDLSIPIAFHVIYASTSNGYVSSTAVNAQVDVLNDAFAPYGLSFTLSSLDYTQNSSWFNNDNESQYKAQLAISPSTTLNIYTTSASGYLGYAYFPNSYSESSYMHGVVLNYDSLPGGAWPYNEGDTGVHEVGHYLGLYHTFEGACYGNGDNVDDTPAQDDGDNIYSCYTMDTCTNNTGNDPIHNFMNYTDDACLTEFTNGQGSRMDYMIATYKPNLGTEVNSDADGDDISDDVDNCPNTANSSQSDYDGDGLGDACDSDIDNDGISNNNDYNDYNYYECSDDDGDSCDDCSSGSYNTSNDGWDYDADGTCDAGDIDDDNDGVIDTQDSDDNNEFVCMDSDGDSCDDCSSGTYSTWNDGDDYDYDGICNIGDMDDDNDGTIDNEDCAPLNELVFDVDCCGSCGGDNSSCSNCCGAPFNDDCTSDCYENPDTGECCYNSEVDECGVCDGNNSSCADECGVPYGDGSSCAYQSGDVNMDNAVNVIDIVLIVDFILGNADFTAQEFTLADASQDGDVNVIDIVMLVEIILYDSIN